MLTLIIHGSRLADNNACNQALEIVKAHVGDRKDVHLILPDYEEITGVVGKVSQWARIVGHQVTYFQAKSRNLWKCSGAIMLLFPARGLTNELADRMKSQAWDSCAECHIHWVSCSFHG